MSEEPEISHERTVTETHVDELDQYFDAEEPQNVDYVAETEEEAEESDEFFDAEGEPDGVVRQSKVMTRLANTLEEVLEVLQDGSLQSFKQNLTSVLSTLPGEFEGTLEGVSVPEQILWNFNTFLQVLEETEKITAEIEEGYLTLFHHGWEIKGQKFLLERLHLLSLALLYEYVQIFEELFKIMGWQIQTSQRLVQCMSTVKENFCLQLCTENLTESHRYGAARFFLRQLARISKSLFEATKVIQSRIQPRFSDGETAGISGETVITETTSSLERRRRKTDSRDPLRLREDKFSEKKKKHKTRAVHDSLWKRFKKLFSRKKTTKKGDIRHPDLNCLQEPSTSKQNTAISKDDVAAKKQTDQEPRSEEQRKKMKCFRCPNIFRKQKKTKKE